jgi:hypothetical protein
MLLMLPLAVFLIGSIVYRNKQCLIKQFCIMLHSLDCLNGNRRYA